ncbi:sigma-70 family RNA polymerase sigma factor [Luteolibacter ambystomatis]|uniref:Sigma-70 family RNA polymerase sigma factor n=1 Tax=Luteolibacter ambystomatis TaxID=2824561 RepID=A0A975G8V4_9BACT|nr:sigma-70 family RNA polymerase sigma factor [Luteolibacter ambystomatis]QUE50440.1 sigma-70 family RNA polymerase sigma factor [Luteolibacter ambystomatis]
MTNFSDSENDEPDPDALPDPIPDEWESWIKEYAWKLYAHARQFCPLQHDAEDLVQAVVAELWNSGADASTLELPFALSRIRHRAIDHLRSESSRSRRESDWHRENHHSEERGAEFPSDTEHDRQRVQAALDQLPLMFREVVSLKLWSDLTFDQIASLLEISRNTAASRYRLALEKLRPLLSPSE